MRLALGVLIALVVAGVTPRGTDAQCLLANPSFELFTGSSFGGWNQFGVVAQDGSQATHGSSAARVTGPNQGGWDLSALWQPLDTSPGDVWQASVTARHLGSNPITGQSSALLNIEWRDAGGALMSYETHTVLNSASPADSALAFTVTSGPAPAGAATTHFLIGVLQSPSDPPPVVIFDACVFERTGPPSPDDLQWGDFPGGTVLNFSGRTWRVKGPGYYGPGPSNFSNHPSSVWVDGSGAMHLTIRNVGGTWYSTEVVLEEALGYGDYVLTTVGRLDLLDPDAVLGIFLWEYRACYDPAYNWWNPYNEIDIEYSRWGNPSNDLGQFVAQPYDFPGNLTRYPAAFAEGEVTSHAMRWLPDRVEYRAWRGGADDEATSPLIHSWTYTGPHVPRPERPRLHLNLWQLDTPATNQEVVFQEFTFTPHDAPVVSVPEGEPLAARVRLRAFPNPFHGSTAIRFRNETAGPARLMVHDVSGRLLREWRYAALPSGPQEQAWDGTDAAGRRLGAGVYFYRLELPEARLSGSVTRLP